VNGPAPHTIHVQPGPHVVQSGVIELTNSISIDAVWLFGDMDSQMRVADSLIARAATYGLLAESFDGRIELIRSTIVDCGHTGLRDGPSRRAFATGLRDGPRDGPSRRAFATGLRDGPRDGQRHDDTRGVDPLGQRTGRERGTDRLRVRFRKLHGGLSPVVDPVRHDGAKSTHSQHRGQSFLVWDDADDARELVR